MKNIVKYIGLVLFILGGVTTISAQDITDSDYRELKQEELNIISQLSTASLNTTPAVTGNTIFIQQIGNQNYVNAQIKAERSTINLYQEGKFNEIELQETSKEVFKELRQIGDDNVIVDFSFNPELNTQLELNQIGNNLTFERIGTNELSKNLKFNMKGNNQTIIVRSF